MESPRQAAAGQRPPIRCLRACRAAESLLRKPHADVRGHQGLERLHRIIEPVRSTLPFQGPARTLERRARLFDELRDALRLQVKPPPHQPAAPADAQPQLAELRDVKKGRRGSTGLAP